jgi:CBS domain containing-hemolysin-like protein
VLTEWLLLGLGVLLTLGTGVFVAAEFALVTLDRPAVERAAQAGDRSAPGILAGLRTLSTQLSGAQVGITLTTLLVGYLVEPSISRLLAAPLAAAGVPDGALTPVSLGLGMFLATLASMLVGELIPKNLALSAPLQTARWAVPLQRAFTFATGPLIRLLNGSANRILQAMGIEPQEELSSSRTPEELASLVRRSAEAGTLDESTATLLARSLGFSSHTAADVMTHRVRVVSVRRDDTAADVVRLARATGYSRFPVVDEDGLDDVAGVVHVKKAIGVPHERRHEVPAAALMSEALRVPETVRLDPLLVQLREQGLQMAVRRGSSRSRTSSRSWWGRWRTSTTVPGPVRAGCATGRGCCPRCCAPTRCVTGCTRRSRTAPRTRPSAASSWPGSAGSRASGTRSR